MTRAAEPGPVAHGDAAREVESLAGASARAGDDMTDLRALDAAGTAAPWSADHNDVMSDAEPSTVAVAWRSENGQDVEDALFIAAARNALPYLLDVVEAAQDVQHVYRLTAGAGDATQSHLADVLAALDAHLRGDTP